MKYVSKVGGEQDVDEESPVPVTEEEYIDVEGSDNNEKDVTVAVQRAILPYQIRYDRAKFSGHFGILST